MRDFDTHVRICASAGCGLPIEEDRARHAKYCRLHGHADAAKRRRVYRGGEQTVVQWRAAHRDLVRQRTRDYVQQFRAREKSKQEQQKEGRG